MPAPCRHHLGRIVLTLCWFAAGVAAGAPGTNGAAAPAPGTKREGLYTGTPPATCPATQPAGWIDAVKRPADWLRWGADQRVRHEYMHSPFLIDSDPPGHQFSLQRYRARLWGTFTPVRPLDLNARLAWEGRYYFDPASKGDWDGSEIFVDTFNATLRLGGGSGNSAAPATLTIGRQDLRYGDGWLVFDGTPLDGSRSVYFDAARLSLDLQAARTTVDAVVLQQEARSDAWLRPFGDEDKLQMEQDERGGLLYVSNRSLMRTQLDAYAIYKHAERVLANGDEGDIFTVGTRVCHELSEHWQLRAEAAYQFGHRDNPVLYPLADGGLSAWGLNTRLTHRLKDQLNTQAYVGYEHLSGDDPNTAANEAFDPLWGRWPQWSDLYTYTMAGETRLAEITNLHRLSAGWQVEPARDVTLCAGYSALLADQNTYAGRAGFSAGGAFRGHLLSAVLRYKLNRHVGGNLVADYLIPGDYYQDAPGPLHVRRDPAAYLRVEVTITF